MEKDTSIETCSYNKNQARSITKFVSRVKRMFISSVFIVAFVFFLVFQPMQAELKKSLTRNYSIPL
jgi:cation transport ATPase